MADNLDKFVLQYIVETKDSLKKLEQLTDKMDSVEKKSGAGGSAIKDVGGHLKNLASEAGGAGEAITGLAEGLETLAATAGPIAAIIGVIMILKKVLSETKDVMDEITSQRDLGQKVGMSALSVENITRNVASAKGSQVDRKGAEDIVTKLATMLRTAYTDPTQMNRSAILLRQTGVSVNGPGGGINDTQVALQQLSERFKTMSEEQAHAYGRLFDLTNQQVDVMRNLGSAITGTTNMTTAEIIARQRALERTNEFNAAQVQLSEHWRELKDDILINVIPALDSLVSALDKIGHHAADAALGFVESLKLAPGRTVTGALMAMNSPSAAIKFLAGMESVHATSEKIKDSSAASAEEAKRIKAAADLSNSSANKQSSDLERIINMFSQSVSQFSNTIDERQAWAAWAGEIGRASGMALSGNQAHGLTGTGGNSAAFDPAAQATMQTGAAGSSGLPGAKAPQSAADDHVFDSLYKQASAATGVPADFLKKIGMAESNQNPVIVSKAGAVGVMQIMPSNNASLGITDARNPQQNIMGGAKLIAQLYKEYGNYEDALKAYNGGQNKDNWNNPETSAYVGRVMAQNATIKDDAALTAAPAKAPASVPAVAQAPTQPTVMPPAANDPNAADAGNPMLSPLMRYQMDPKAKPLYSFSGKSFVDPGAGGESREKSQLYNIQNLLAQQLGTPLEQVQQGGVSQGDIKYAASNIMAQLENSRYTLTNQLSVPGMTQMQRGGLQQQLRTTDLQIQGMMRYMPQIQDKAMPGDRNITIGQGAVQVVVQGANVTAEQLAKEINNTFSDHLNEVVNGLNNGVSH